MIRNVCAVVAIGVLTAGCSSSAPKCYSAEAIETVTRLAKQRMTEQVLRDNVMRMVFNPETSRYDLKGIRTVEENRNARSCKASLHVAFDLADSVKRTKDTKPAEWAQINSSNVIAGMAREADFDIAYLIERSDDGKEFYVTLEGL